MVGGSSCYSQNQSLLSFEEGENFLVFRGMVIYRRQRVVDRGNGAALFRVA
jgi:hypothetical protein